MILAEFSEFLQKHDEEIIDGSKSTTDLLCEWIKDIINKNPRNNVEKIIHKEIMLAQNDTEDFLILGKSDSGRILINALNNFTKSYENYIMSKWLSDKKPHHFINYPNQPK